MPKILAIDPNNDILIGLKASIDDAFPGSLVLTSQAGQKGIELATVNNPDVILLGLNMPDINGFEVCRLLKLDERTNEIPMVFLTAMNEDKENRKKAIEVGAEGFLSKPIDETELTAQIRAMVKIKVANEQKCDEKARLTMLVEERTMALQNELRQQKQAEEFLLESEYFFRESQRAAFVGSYKFNLRNDFWSSSEVLEQIFGIDENYNRSLNGWLDIIHPDDKEMMATYFSEDVVDKRNAFNKEYRIIRQSDGEIRWVLGLGKLNFDAEDNITEMIGTIQDITERKQAEIALKESEERFKHGFETANVGKSMTLPNGEINVNQALCNMLGYTQEELKGKNWKDITPPDEIENTQAFMNSMIKGEKDSVRFYKCYIHKDGSLVWTDISSALLRDPDGKPIHFITTIIDITERKKTEDALRESVQLFQGLFNASPDAIVLIDPSHPTISWPIVDCNSAACLMNGYARQEMIGQSIDLLNVSDGTPDDRISYFTVLKREGIVHSENYHHHKDGHNFPIETSTSIVSIGGLEMVLGIDRDITERKQAEVALKKSEDRYRQFISQISEGVYRFECDQPMDISLPVEEQVDFIYDHMFIAECNDAFMKMYRIADRSEIIGKRHLDFHGGRSHPLNREIMRNFVKSGYHIENAITEEAGFEGQYLVISNNWLGIMENNQLIRMWGTQFDITEKIRAEKVQHMLYSISNATLSTVDLSELIETISNELGKLLDSTNFFIAFYDEKTNMLSTIYEKDEKDTIDTWSAEKSITGYVIRNEKSLLIHEAEVLDLIKTGEIENVGTLSKVWLGVPLKLNNKVIGAIVVQSYDNPEAYSEKDKLMLEFVSHQISASIERKKIEQELKLMGKAFDQSPVTIVITDKNGNIEYTNPKFSETTGYVSEEVRGKNPRVLQSGSQSKAYYQELWRTILAGNDWFGEFQNKRKNGELYWESAVISPITDESGDITFFMAIKEEITEKKKMIADLIQARNKAEESDRLKSSFLANMSHEIRTPLNSIIGFSELMTDRDLDADQQSEFAKIIQNSGNSLLSIISDIMDFSKIEAGQIKINKFPFVTQKLISEIQKEYSIVAQAKGIELRIDSLNPKEDIWMTSDENRLRQILINLVGNAIKFTKEGYVELGIKALGDCVQFRVTDTGIGIPEEYHNKIFERFRQVESANSRKYGGNGLGLAISKSLVEILGGEIWIESVQRKGSTFYFTIPIDNTTI